MPRPLSRPTHEPPAIGHAEIAALVTLTLVGLLVRLALAAHNSGLTMDSPLYVEMAEHLRGGPAVSGPAHHGYPALVALLSFVVPGRELPARALSMLAGVALIPLVHAVARRRAGPWGGALAAALVALHPLIAVYSGAVMTESLFLAILALGLLLAEARRPFWGGLALGLGYAVRPEALVIAAGAALLSGWRRGARTVLGFAAAAVPYMVLLSVMAGGPTISPKSVLLRPGFENWRQAEWRLDDSTRTTPAPPRTLGARIRWAAPAIARDYLPQLTRHLKRVLEVWPVPLLALSLVGLAIRAGPVAAPLFYPFALALLAVPDDPRFALILVPSLAVLAAGAVERLAGAWRVRIVRGLAVVVCLAGLWFCWMGRPGLEAWAFDDGPMPELRMAGEWLASHGEPGSTVMDRKSYVAYFAHMHHVSLPDNDLDAVVDYAQRTGVDYLVAEEYVAETLRPQLRPLLAGPAWFRSDHRLRPVYVARAAPGTGIVICQVERPR